MALYVAAGDEGETSAAGEGTPIYLETRDLAGNAPAAGRLRVGTARFDFTPPPSPAVSVADAIVYMRAPWGAPETGGVATFALQGGSGAVEPGALVLVFDGPEQQDAGSVGEQRAGDGGAFGGPLGSAGRWSEITRSAQEPPARLGHSAAHAPLLGGVIVFGGEGREVGACSDPSSFYCRDTWHYGEQGWTLLASSGPEARAWSALTYDATRGREGLVLFGGQPESGSRQADTWVYDAGGWRDTGATGVTGRAEHAMAYDPGREVVVLFGGRAGFGVDCGEGTGEVCGYTWEWDGNDWSPVCSDPTCLATAPSPRWSHAMAFDGRSGQVVVFGGCEAEPCWDGGEDFNAPNVLYQWDGQRWSTVCDASPCRDTAPSPRHQASLTFDTDRQTLVLYGGYRGAVGGCGEAGGWTCTDTWEFNGGSWTRAAVAGPEARRASVLSFDAAGGRTVMFGGELEAGPGNDTWEWEGGAGGRPAEVFSVELAAAGETLDGITLREVRSSWVASAGGYDPSGAAVNGAQLSVWSLGRWTSVATWPTVSLAATQAITWSTATDPAWAGLDESERAARARQLFSGVGATLHQALSPVGSNGPGSAADRNEPHARVRVDYVETTVRYRLP